MDPATAPQELRDRCEALMPAVGEVADRLANGVVHSLLLVHGADPNDVRPGDIMMAMMCAIAAMAVGCVDPANPGREIIAELQEILGDLYAERMTMGETRQ